MVFAACHVTRFANIWTKQPETVYDYSYYTDTYSSKIMQQILSRNLINFVNSEIAYN